MTLLETIEDKVSCLPTPTRFVYSTLEEANATIFDELLTGQFPVCLILALDIEDYSRENGLVKSQAEINALFLDRVPRETIDKPVSEVENEVIAPMRSLSRELINRLDKSDIVEENGIESVVHRSVHEALMDAHLYGNWAVFTIKFSEDLTTCVHDNQGGS